MRSAGTEVGAAGLLAVWVAAVVLAVTGAGVVWGGAVTARHRAGRAADLSALAGATAAAAGAFGPGQPCAEAALVATANGAVVTGCAVAADGSVLVAVQVATPRALRFLGMPPARARARAGALP